jgi:hypothetical protein
MKEINLIVALSGAMCQLCLFCKSARGMRKKNSGGGVIASRLLARVTPGGGPVWWPDPRGVGSVGGTFGGYGI